MRSGSSNSSKNTSEVSFDSSISFQVEHPTIQVSFFGPRRTRQGNLNETYIALCYTTSHLLIFISANRILRANVKN